MSRPSWDKMFLETAFLWSRRSHDIHTKHGCIFVKDKTIISHGYNGFIRNIDDSILPTSRPEKYDYMVHAEQNAIYNCARNGISTLGATAYITGMPCISCFQALYQVGIVKIIVSDYVNTNMMDNDDYKEKIKLLQMLADLSIIYIPKESL